MGTISKRYTWQTKWSQYIYNVGRLRMWSNWKMKSVALIHNDDVKCFHMVVQGTHKIVVMSCINALIKK
jgi:hypothetical protein